MFLRVGIGGGVVIVVGVVAVVIIVIVNFYDILLYLESKLRCEFF